MMHLFRGVESINKHVSTATQLVATIHAHHPLRALRTSIKSHCLMILSLGTAAHFCDFDKIIEEAGSYLRLIDFVYHSTLGLRVIKKKKVGTTLRESVRDPRSSLAPPSRGETWYRVEGSGLWG